jgi:hypothetical protein
MQDDRRTLPCGREARKMGSLGPTVRPSLSPAQPNPAGWVLVSKNPLRPNGLRYPASSANRGHSNRQFVPHDSPARRAGPRNRRMHDETQDTSRGPTRGAIPAFFSFPSFTSQPFMARSSSFRLITRGNADVLPNDSIWR